MTDVTREQIETVLLAYQVPYLEKDLITAGAIKHISITADQVEIGINLGFPAENYHEQLVDDLKTQLRDVVDAELQISIETNVIPHAVQRSLGHLDNVKNIIAVASGKGGVGKSTTSVNLALALKAEGATVGILDADIYGPSQTHMLGIKGKPESKDNKTFEPMEPYGIQTMSIGLLIDEDTPMIWRGPMATQTLQQLLNETNWRDLDYLIVDLPPGTGDIQLTLAQKIPVSGAVIVTTPQDIALLDARKALKMFEKVEVPVLGVIENMSIHICSECGHAEHIFGEGGGAHMAENYNVKLLGSLPLDIRIRQQADGGKPTVLAEPDSRITDIYCDIARKMTASLSMRTKDYSGAFPKIVIQND